MLLKNFNQAVEKIQREDQKMRRLLGESQGCQIIIKLVIFKCARSSTHH